MRERNDEELYAIVHFGSEDGFVPDAIMAAKNEFDQRSLDSEQESELAHAIENKRQQKKMLAEKPLSWLARIQIEWLCFLADLAIISNKPLHADGLKTAGEFGRYLQSQFKIQTYLSLLPAWQ